MCVIFGCESALPKENELFAAEKINSHGAGIAWIDKTDKKNPTVRWVKGIDAKEVIKMAPKLPFPLVIHFRIASSGAEVPELTHPFPLSYNAEDWLEGTCSNGVLFHNGTLTGWRADLREAVHRSKKMLTGGHWNDTRAMAWLIGNFGMGYVSLIQPEQKLAILHPQTGLWFGPEDEWYGGEKEGHKGFYYSNRGWIPVHKSSGGNWKGSSDSKEEKQASTQVTTHAGGMGSRAKVLPVGSEASLARVTELVAELDKGKVRLLV